MRDRLPTAKDISPTDGLDLDEKYALDNFLGKTVEEAKAVFSENDLHYSSDLIWMGDKAFAYYFPAYFEYLKSSSDVDDNSLNALVTVLNCRLENSERSVRESKVLIRDCILYCLKKHDSLDVNQDIYKTLKDDLLALLERVEQLN